VSVARDFLRDVLITNATDITEDALEEPERTWTKLKKYCPTKLFQHVNLFSKGRGKWVQHAKDSLNMTPLRYLLISFVIVLLRETMFTKQKWAHAVGTMI
jgi:hypothetical protein